MRRSSHIRPTPSIVGALCTVIGLTWVMFSISCQRSDEPPLPSRDEPEPRSILPEPTTRISDAGDPWVVHQVRELRDRTLQWTPREVSLQRVTFAGNRLYTTLRSTIVVAEPSSHGKTQRVAAKGLHQLAPLADTSVIVVGAINTFVIRPDARQTQALRKIMLMPQEHLFGNAGLAENVDAFDPTAGRWSGYSFNSMSNLSLVWLPDTQYDIPELKQGLCAQLIDGTYGCYAQDQLWHLVSRSRPELAGKCGLGSPVWRVLGGPRADQMWLARADGTLEKWWLVAPPKRLAVVPLPFTPLDVAVQGDTIAVIRIIQDRERPKQLSLVVLNAQGQQRFEQSLMSSTDDELSHVEPDLLESEVVVHPKRPWVALRTSQGTRVLDANKGVTLYEVR